MRRLRGSVGIVTGASSGLGYETALLLGLQGVKVCVTARTGPGLDLLAKRITFGGGECLVVPGDVTRDEDVGRVVHACLERFGRVDFLINNAGVTRYARFEELTWAEIERLVDVNFYGYLRFAREVLPHMREQGEGHIINVLSVLSKVNMPLFSLYSATKHALLGWSETLRRELAGSGIRVSGVLMPALATPLYDHVATTQEWAPRPLPPIYPTRWAARSLVWQVRFPRALSAPSFIQGHALVWAAHALRKPADLFLRLFAKRIQLRKGVHPRREGNLFLPSHEPLGPDGTLRPTPRALRWVPGVAAAAAAAAAAWSGRRVLVRS